MQGFWLKNDRIQLGIGIDILNDREHIPSLLTRCRGLYEYVEIFDGGNPNSVQLLDELALIKTPTLYHNPVLNLCGDAIAEETIIICSSSSASALNAGWAVEEMGYSSIDGHSIPYFMPAVLTEASARKAVANLRTLNSLFCVPILPETPAFEIVLGDITLERFVRIIVDECDTDFVLDITHVMSYAHATGRDIAKCCKAMPLNRVREVHLAGGAFVESNGIQVFRDTHGSQRIPKLVIQTLLELLPELNCLEAITIEVDGGSGPYAEEDIVDVRRSIGL